MGPVACQCDGTLYFERGRVRQWAEPCGLVFGRTLLETRPDLPDGGFHLPLVETGLLRFAPPREFSVCSAATLGDARGDSISDPGKIVMEPHVNSGHESATQLKRVLVDPDGGASHSVNHVDDVLGNCDVCRAFAGAPHVPIAGTSAVSMCNEEVQVDLLFLGDVVVAHAMDVFSKYSLLHPVQSENPQEVRGVFCAGWLPTFGRPKCIRMDEGGEWENEIWADFCAERRIKMQF